LIDQNGRTATLSAVRNALCATQPKRPRVTFSLVESDGVLQLVATNTGGVQVTPIDLLGQDLLGSVELRVLLNAGEQSVTSLPTFYDSVIFWRVWKKKNGDDPKMKVVARGKASPRPFIEPVASWLMTGQVLAIDLTNTGGNMRQNTTLVVELGERKLLVTAIQLAAASSTVVHINPDKLVAEGEKLEELPPLTIKITGMADIALAIPPVSKPEAEVAAALVEAAEQLQAGYPLSVAQHWDGNTLVVTLTRTEGELGENLYAYIEAEERMLTTGQEISLTSVGDSVELRVPNAKVGAIMNLWLDGDVAFEGMEVIDKQSSITKAQDTAPVSPSLAETAYM